MRIASALFAMVSLIPAAMAPVPVMASARVLQVAICNGDGIARTIDIEVPGKPARHDENPCCAKGCHTGCNRKRNARQFDPSQ